MMHIAEVEMQEREWRHQYLNNNFKSYSNVFEMHRGIQPVWVLLVEHKLKVRKRKRNLHQHQLPAPAKNAQTCKKDYHYHVLVPSRDKILETTLSTAGYQDDP